MFLKLKIGRILEKNMENLMGIYLRFVPLSKTKYRVLYFGKEIGEVFKSGKGWYSSRGESTHGPHMNRDRAADHLMRLFL